MSLVLLELQSLSGDILNNSESNKTYISDKVSNFLIAELNLEVYSVIDTDISL